MKFRKKKQKISVGASPGVKYLAKLVKGETVSFKTMSKMMSNSSTVSRGDVLNVLDSMVTQTLFMLKQGNSVKFDGLGRFYVKTKVKAVGTKEEVTIDTIEKITIGFVPDIDFKSDMKDIQITIEEPANL